MKSRIEIRKIATGEENEKRLSFYLHNDWGTYWLFDQRFSKGVCGYFEKNRAVTEIFGFHDWNKDPRVDRVILKLRKNIKYIYNMEQYSDDCFYAAKYPEKQYA